MPQLNETLDAGPTGDLPFIVTRRGTPWSAPRTEFVAAAPTSRGLRKIGLRGPQAGAATRANGATERELGGDLRLVRGRMATLYTKSANRTRLAAGAIGKLDRGKTENGNIYSSTYG